MVVLARSHPTAARVWVSDMYGEYLTEYVKPIPENTHQQWVRDLFEFCTTDELEEDYWVTHIIWLRNYDSWVYSLSEVQWQSVLNLISHTIRYWRVIQWYCICSNHYIWLPKMLIVHLKIYSSCCVCIFYCIVDILDWDKCCIFIWYTI